MWALILAALLGGVKVTATPHVGAPASGELQAIGADGLKLKSADGEKTIQLKTLRRIEFPAANGDSEPHDGPIVELIDGSQLLAQSFLSQAGQAVIQLGDKKLTTPTRNVRAVLLRSQRNLPDLQKSWRELIEGDTQGDMAVVRRTRPVDGDRVEHSLDQLECVLRDVSATELQYRLEDEERKAPLEKLEGFIYFHSRKAELKKALADVRTTDGMRVIASSLTSADESLEMVTRSGLSIKVPLAKIRSIQLSSGDVVYLSDLKPERVDWRPYVPTRIGGDRLRKLYLPRMDKANDGGQLRLEPGGDVFEKGISLHSRTELAYRLPDAYKRLRAQAGLDPKYRNAGDVELIIKSESKELFRQAITPENPRLKIDLDVTGARRLTVIIDFGEGWDVSDYVNFCDARLSK